jgi:hypothetical protein
MIKGIIVKTDEVSNYPPISKHSVYLFYPFYFPSFSRQGVDECLISKLERLVIAEVCKELQLHKDIEDRLQKPERQNCPIWESEDVKISDDLHEYVCRILVGASSKDATDYGNLFYGHHPYRITAEFKNLLTGEWGKFGRGLEIKLNNSAVRRLGLDNPWVPVWIKDMKLYITGAGVGLVSIEINYSKPGRNEAGLQPDPEIIAEGNYVCIRSNRQASKLRWSGCADSGAFAMEDLVKALIPGLSIDDNGKQYAHKTNVAGWSRIFTYTAIQFSEKLADNTGRLENLVFRLSRKYTTDYIPAKDQIRQGLLQPFENIIHAVSLEGGAVVVEEKDVDGNKLNFFESFIQDHVVKVYLPLAILAYQEYQTLIKMTQGTFQPIDFQRSTDQIRGVLAQCHEELLDFRLNYRFSHVSRISMHNEVYNAWRKAFSLDKMLSELMQDVREIESYLSNKLEQKRAFRNAYIGIWTGIMGVLATVFGLYPAKFRELIFKEFPYNSLLYTLRAHWHYITLIVITILALAVIGVSAHLILKSRKISRNQQDYQSSIKFAGD